MMHAVCAHALSPSHTHTPDSTTHTHKLSLSHTPGSSVCLSLSLLSGSYRSWRGGGRRGLSISHTHAHWHPPISNTHTRLLLLPPRARTHASLAHAHALPIAPACSFHTQVPLAHAGTHCPLASLAHAHWHAYYCPRVLISFARTRASLAHAHAPPTLAPAYSLHTQVPSPPAGLFRVQL
jgi:hypothetical protein